MTKRRHACRLALFATVLCGISVSTGFSQTEDGSSVDSTLSSGQGDQGAYEISAGYGGYYGTSEGPPNLDSSGEVLPSASDMPEPPDDGRTLPEGEGEGGGGGRVPNDELSEMCDTSGTSANYSETLSGAGERQLRIVASTTGCPNHINWPLNPNSARETPSNTTIPAYPKLFAHGASTDLSQSAGAVGILFNGVSAASSWAAGVADSYENSAFYAEGDTFDPCGGHSTATGWYHYHNTAGCLQEQAMAAEGSLLGSHSPQLGWSYDGFPIYGQKGPGGIEMKVCGQDGADAVHCLDLCSGYEAIIADVDDFKYRYYMSCGFDASFFPFTVNCFRGCCPDGMQCNSHVGACGNTTTAGYLDGYKPTPSRSLAETYDATFIKGVDAQLVGSNTSINCSLYAASRTEVGASTDTPTPAPLSNGESSSASSSTWTWAPSSSSSSLPTSSPTSAPSSSPTSSQLPSFTARPSAVASTADSRVEYSAAPFSQEDQTGPDASDTSEAAFSARLHPCAAAIVTLVSVASAIITTAPRQTQGIARASIVS